MNEPKAPENRAYKVTLILLLGLAAFSTAMKELNRVHEMVSSVQEFTRQWRGTDLVTLNQKPVSTNQSCSNDNPHLIIASAGSGSGDSTAAVSDVDIHQIAFDTIPEPELGARVDWIAGQSAKRNLPQLARAKYAPAGNPKTEITL